VYDRYGRDRAAQVANVVTYRARSALREMAKVCGLSPGHADAIASHVDRWADLGSPARAAKPGPPGPPLLPVDRGIEGLRADPAESGVPLPELVVDLARQVDGFPRLLGIHSGGMVMADRPLVEYCPVEWARMEGRSV